MATAKKLVSIELSLSEDEAKILSAVLAQIRGNSFDSPRGLTDNIRHALEEQGIGYGFTRVALDEGDILGITLPDRPLDDLIGDDSF
jgi:hypothetical protein